MPVDVCAGTMGAIHCQGPWLTFFHTAVPFIGYKLLFACGLLPLAGGVCLSWLVLLILHARFGSVA